MRQRSGRRISVSPQPIHSGRPATGQQSRAGLDDTWWILFFASNSRACASTCSDLGNCLPTFLGSNLDWLQMQYEWFLCEIFNSFDWFHPLASMLHCWSKLVVSILIFFSNKQGQELSYLAIILHHAVTTLFNENFQDLVNIFAFCFCFD